MALSQGSNIALSVDLPETRFDDGRDDNRPAVRAVDELHEAALRHSASDIHVEPTSSGGRVRQRVDGILHEVRHVQPALYAQIVSRIKLLAGMDIADKRQPQDGRYHIELQGRLVDARVSSMPTIGGERVVVRLLDMQSHIPPLERLGMPTTMLEPYRNLIHAPHGFVVVCGPTGSGKTTTLYASLSERNVVGQHLCTIEDPVEAQIPGVAQVQVNVRAGLSFASALRSFLRQDPNAIMVGEMRDEETAAVAMSAALCGQLVLTSLHSNDAPRTIERLLELGLKRHAIAAGLSGVIAQRLVRQLCPSCRRRCRIAEGDARTFGIEPDSFVHEPVGCDRCSHAGYCGRSGIFEFIEITNEIRALIANNGSSVAVAEAARANGYSPMIVDAVRHLRCGDTSVEEVRRVLALECR